MLKGAVNFISRRNSLTCHLKSFIAYERLHARGDGSRRFAEKNRLPLHSFGDVLRRGRGVITGLKAANNLENRRSLRRLWEAHRDALRSAVDHGCQFGDALGLGMGDQ